MLQLKNPFVLLSAHALGFGFEVFYGVGLANDGAAEKQITLVVDFACGCWSKVWTLKRG